MGFFERLQSIDRRVVYVLMALAVAIPLLTRVVFPIRVSEPVRGAYQAVESLSPGSVVLVSIDYDPSSMPEVQPMLIAVLRHCFSRDLRVVMMGHLPLGLPLGQMGLEQVAGEFDREYGTDYVNLGYRPGYIAIMVGMGREIREFFRTDVRGNPIDELPLTKGIHNYNEIDLLVGLEHGYAGDWWVQVAQARFGQRIVLGTTAVMAPDCYPYLQARQIEGLIGGLKGAAEYETLIGQPAVGTLGMPAQSAAHCLILLFIILGNVGYFVTRRRR